MHSTPYHDYFDYKMWIYNSYSLGLKKVYVLDPKTNVYQVDQPPGTIYTLRISYEVFLITAKALNRFFGVDPNAQLWVNDQLLVFFFRFPSIIADLTLGFFIYLLVKSKKGLKIGLIASSFFLFNPSVIYNSSIWGQMDSINNLFLFISLFFLVNKKISLTVFFFGLSIFIKFSLLPLLPLYALLLFFGSGFRLKHVVISSLITATVFLVLCIPFFINPFVIFSFAQIASQGRAQAITVNAFNFWHIIFNPPLVIEAPQIKTVFYGLGLGAWANLLFSAFYIPILYKTFRNIKAGIKTVDVYLIFTLAVFAIFLFMPKMHERYLYPTIPLLITWVALKNKYWMFAIILSILHFLNLYVVWNPSLFLFGPFEDALKSQTSVFAISLLTLGVFVFLFINLLVDNRRHKV